MGIFHANDIRGIVGHHAAHGSGLNAAIAWRIGYAIPGLLNTRRVLVGRDARASSPPLHQALTNGIRDAGADAVCMGLATTPMVWFACARHRFDAAVCITASHNPPQYNGFKIAGRDSAPIGADNGLARLAQRVAADTMTPTGTRGDLLAMDPMGEYLEFLATNTPALDELTLSVDCGHGMASLLARRVFGARAHLLFDTLDGSFPAHSPDPSKPSAREAIVRDVRQRGSDVGIIFDGDADRVMFIDETGAFVPPDLVLAVLGEQAIHAGDERRLFLQDVRGSRAVSHFLAQLGGRTETGKVGRAFAATRLREMDGTVGGELAGHYYFRDFSYSDSAMLAALRVLDVVIREKRAGRSFSQLIASIKRYHGSGEHSFADIDGSAAIAAVRAHFEAHDPPPGIQDIDGCRMDFEDWWFSIRRSNTEPLVRLVVEADTPDRMQSQLESITRIIHTCPLRLPA